MNPFLVIDSSTIATPLWIVMNLPITSGLAPRMDLEMIWTTLEMTTMTMTTSSTLSSTYNLHLASGCYSDEKRDKSDRRRYNSERRRCKSDVEEDKSYREGVQHLKKRKEDVGGEGVSFSLCAFGEAELRWRSRSRSRSRS